jgi:hypothetical protein
VRIAAVVVVVLAGCNEILGIEPFTSRPPSGDAAGHAQDAMDVMRDVGAPACASSYGNIFNGHRYQIAQVGDQKAFDAADDVCRIDGGHLVKIEDAGENLVIQNIIASTGNAWIGLSDRAMEGTFVWSIDGAVAVYTAWSNGEPNNSGGNENCVVETTANGTWNDTNCDNVESYVCECDASAP